MLGKILTFVLNHHSTRVSFPHSCACSFSQPHESTVKSQPNLTQIYATPWYIRQILNYINRELGKLRPSRAKRNRGGGGEGFFISLSQHKSTQIHTYTHTHKQKSHAWWSWCSRYMTVRHRLRRHRRVVIVVEDGRKIGHELFFYD